MTDFLNVTTNIVNFLLRNRLHKCWFFIEFTLLNSEPDIDCDQILPSLIVSSVLHVQYIICLMLDISISHQYSQQHFLSRVYSYLPSQG